MLSTTIESVILKSCLYNASGCWCVTKKELEDVFDSKAGAVISKSCTFSPREGNPKPRLYKNEFGSINSMGMPNKGYRFYTYMAQELQKRGRVSGKENKPYITSVSGIDLEELISMLSYIDKQGPSIKRLVEVNLSCPNIPGEAQVSYDFERMDSSLARIFSQKYNNILIGLKLSPYFDPSHIKEVATILRKYPLHFITCINSLGNGMVINPDTDKAAIVPKKGLGGVGGIYCKPIALSNVFQFYRELGSKIAVIGCGGVQCGRDAYEHILCGASAVQIGTQLVKEGVGCFERIERELLEIMREKGYGSIDEFRGLLHE